MLLHDLKSITSLSENVPLTYWKMHSQNGGIGNLFLYQNSIKKWAIEKMKNCSEAEKISHLMDFTQV